MAEEQKGTALPDVLPASDLPADAETYDVVVAGFGIAGGCAALEAARAGARVLLLERAAVHGGTSSMSGGHFYLGGGTAVQKATGHDDSAEEMYKYLVAVSKEPEHDKIRAYCEGSVEHFDWLESLGFEFERSYFPGKAVIQPGTEGLMFTGNEKVWPYVEQAVPAPRGHKVPVPGDTEGTKIVMDLLRERVDEAGVEVRYETGVTHLVTDDAGAVVGVAWRSFDRTGVIAASSVIVAAGGFVMNPDMVAEHTPALGSKLFTLGSTYDDGLGIRLGASVGAELKHMDEPFITAPFYPPSVLVTGLIVNADGQAVRRRGQLPRPHLARRDAAARLRGVPDRGQRARGVPQDAAGAAARRVRDGRGDGGCAGRARSRRCRRRSTATTSTPRTDDDPDFHKSADWLAAQDQAPWAVFDLRLGNALYAGFTLGGIRVSVDGEAQRPDGSVIPGLYAAGACASNLAQDGAGLLLRHPARRGVVLRAPGGSSRRRRHHLASAG